MPRGTFQDCCCQCLCPCDEPVLAHVSTGDPLTLADSFGSVSCGVTVPFLCARFCLYPTRLESVFLPVLWRSYSQIPLGFKARFPGDSQSLCQIPRLGSLLWSSEHSQQWENLFGLLLLIVIDITILQFVGHPSGGYGIWFYHYWAPPTILLQFFFVFGPVVSFYGGFQCPPVNGCSADSCNFGALAGGDEHISFYSAILNWKRK